MDTFNRGNVQQMTKFYMVLQYIYSAKLSAKTQRYPASELLYNSLWHPGPEVE